MTSASHCFAVQAMSFSRRWPRARVRVHHTHIAYISIEPRKAWPCPHTSAPSLALTLRPPNPTARQPPAMALVFSEFRYNGCSFLVAGRQDSTSGRFLQLSDIEVIPEMHDLFRALPESDFRADISSTELRQRGEGLKSPRSGSASPEGSEEELRSPWPSPKLPGR